MDRKKNMKLGLTAMAVFAAVVLFFTLDISCPIRAAAGVPCPACGLTRATLAFLQGDIGRAFYYHPLFPLAWVVFVLLAVYLGLGAKKKLTPKGELAFIIIFVAIAVAFIAVYLVRLINGWIP